MAEKASLPDNVSYREAMTTLIAERFGALWKAVPAALEGTDPEGVHDVRVASRRLRAAMDVAVDCFPQAWYRKLHAKAKEITSALGEVRDREVLLAFFEKEREKAAPDEGAGITRLIDRLTDELEAARLDMNEYLQATIRSSVAEESVRRFGELSHAPWMDDH